MSPVAVAMTPSQELKRLRQRAIRQLVASRPVGSQRELVDAFRTELRDRLGVREAPESRANAIVRGTIQRYEVDIPVAYSADNRATTTALRMLQIVVDLELVDQVTGETLWSRKGFVADGKYEERGEPAARREAIARVVNALVEGAQSQW